MNEHSSEIDYRMPRRNLLCIGVGVLVIVLGFVLMMVGPNSTDTAFEPDIFSFRRIVVAPMVVFFGFLSIVVAIFWPTKKHKSLNK